MKCLYGIYDNSYPDIYALFLYVFFKQNQKLEKKTKM